MTTSIAAASYEKNFQMGNLCGKELSVTFGMQLFGILHIELCWEQEQEN